MKNIRKTVISVDVSIPRHTLKQDILETITGISSSAITVGGKITAETVVYSNKTTPSQQTAGFVFSTLSLAASGIDFLMVPFGYLYKLYAKKPVPFNVENNIKWALATVALVLSIVSTAVVSTSHVISFVTVGITLVTGIVSFFKYFYDMNKIKKEVLCCEEVISSIEDAIRDDMRNINRLQNELQFLRLGRHFRLDEEQDMISQLTVAQNKYEADCRAINDEYLKKRRYQRTLANQNPAVEVFSNALKIVLSIAVLAGTILLLNPVTLPIGMPIIAAAAVTALLVLLAHKARELYKKRAEQRLARIKDVQIPIEINDTVGIIRTFKKSPAAVSVETQDSNATKPESELLIKPSEKDAYLKQRTETADRNSQARPGF